MSPRLILVSTVAVAMAKITWSGTRNAMIQSVLRSDTQNSGSLVNMKR